MMIMIPCTFVMTDCGNGGASGTSISIDKTYSDLFPEDEQKQSIDAVWLANDMYSTDFMLVEADREYTFSFKKSEKTDVDGY